MTDNQKEYRYHVAWSSLDKAYVGRCPEFPSLSWLAETPEGALAGIKSIVADMRVKDKSLPGWVQESSQKATDGTDRNVEKLEKTLGDIRDCKKSSWIGIFKDDIKIQGDVVIPVADPEDWEVNKP